MNKISSAINLYMYFNSGLYYVLIVESVMELSNLSRNARAQHVHGVDIFFIQFNVPFKIISLKETSQWVGGAKREYPEKTT